MKTRRAGISLLETVMAATLLSGSVMMVCSISGRSLRSVRLNQEHEKAWDYVARQMALVEQVGVETVIESGGLSGQIDGGDGQSWLWEIRAEETSIETLYDVTVEIKWMSGNRVRSVQCQSRVIGEVVDFGRQPEQSEQGTEQPAM